MQVSAIALWLNSFFSGFDQSISVAVHELYNMAGDFFTSFFTFISLLGKGGIFLIILSLALIFFKRTRRFGVAMLFGIAIGAIFTNCCLKILIARPRPYIDENGIFYQMWLLVGQHIESDKSFPSGHTTAAFAAMTALFITGDKRISWTAFIFAFLMGISRIYLVVHYPSDVLGGLVVGVVAGILGALAAKHLPASAYQYDFIKPKQEPKHLAQ